MTILFIYYDFIIGNKRNSAPGMERLSSKNPYRRQISSVSKKESWLYNKWYQFWQINNIFDRVELLFSNKLFSPNKTLVENNKKMEFYRSLFDPFAQERFVYIIIHLHLVFPFDRINSLSGNFYLSSLVDFSALWTNISAEVTIIYNKSVFIFRLISSPGACLFWKWEDPWDKFANFQTKCQMSPPDFWILPSNGN